MLSIVHSRTVSINQNGWGYLRDIIPSPFNPTAWKVILSYMAVELALMR
jgi:hypothetical protein